MKLSKMGFLMALSASAALWGTGCATEASEPLTAEEIANIEADDKVEGTDEKVAAVDDSAEATDESLAATNENAGAEDGDDEVTDESADALEAQPWWGHRRRMHRRWRRHDRRWDRWDRWNDWDDWNRWDYRYFDGCGVNRRCFW